MWEMWQVERERAGKRMLEKQSLIVENTLKAEEAKVKILDLKINMHNLFFFNRRGSLKR